MTTSAVISQAAAIVDLSEFAEAADVLDLVRPRPRPGQLVGTWVPDPSRAPRLMCVWVPASSP